LPPRSQVVLESRKSPVQAHSTASVDAILDATIQSDPLTTEPELVALVLQGAMWGLVEECWNRALPAMLVKNFPCENRGFEHFVLQMVGENVTRIVTKSTP